MWSMVLNILGIKVPLWIVLIMGVALGGLFIMHKIDSARIDAFKIEVAQLKEEKRQLEEVVKEKEKAIANLQDTIIGTQKTLKEYQDRNTKLLKIISGFGPTVVVPVTGKNEMGVVNKKDSDKFIQWMNEEIWK